MFALIEEYDVQKTRNAAREEGIVEGIEKGMVEGIEKGIEAKALRAAERALKRGADPADIAYDLELPLSTIMEIEQKIS